MKKFAVIGHFAFGLEYLDGQTVKTRELTRALCGCFGENAVDKVDSHGWSGNPVRFFRQVWQAAKQAEHVLILPAHNGLRVLVPLLSMAGKRCKLHYAVIGGWLPRLLKDKPGLAKQLKKFAGIYVETGTMKNALEAMGFSNIQLMPNCKQLQILTPEQLPPQQSPLRLCTFSRVMEEKGIADGVEAVKAVNRQAGRQVYTLDIYGPVDPAQTQWFARLQETFPEEVRYCGTVPSDRSVDVLKNYFALLFPTRFFTEGIPGTVIDAYAAGVPVISARWESYADVIDEGQTGYGYPITDIDALIQLLESIATAPERITELKENCLKKAYNYTPAEAVAVLLRNCSDPIPETKK